VTLTPRQLLERGVEELAPLLAPAGFTFVHTDAGDESASGEFRRGDRVLELRVRRSLNVVWYHFAEHTLSHEDLVRGVGALDKIEQAPQYPGFSEDPMDGFRHLRVDLERFGDIFLKGGAKAFRALKKWLDKHPKKSGLAGLGR
jgi:hypothetical protein